MQKQIKKVKTPAGLIEPKVLGPKIKKIFSAANVDIGNWFVVGDAGTVGWKIFVYISSNIENMARMNFSALEELSILLKTKNIYISEVDVDHEDNYACFCLGAFVPGVLKVKDKKK